MVAAFRVSRGLACILLVATVRASAAVPAPPGVVAGRVIDETGGALPGMVVELSAAGARRSTVTDERGEYRLEDVHPGRYVLEISGLNFAGARREVLVEASRTVTADITLHLALNADVTVTGRETFRNLADQEHPEENLIGVAESASQGAVTAHQLEQRPILRAGEVLEAVPGVVISQHSGEGKANQYYLRGFNLDHGTDFATTVAGVPVNLPTHGHGQGYTDVNFLIPELVTGVQFEKGPYFAEQGDFSAAGAVNVNYASTLPAPLLRLSGGQDGWTRLLGAAAPALGRGHLLLALEGVRNDGPWSRPDDYRRLNGVVRYSRGDARNGFTLTGQGYVADWHATDQVPARALASGRLGRFEGVDASDGGTTSRYSLAADMQRTRGRRMTRLSAFVVGYRLNLFSNFTYFLDDPEHGDQFEQGDRRSIIGLRASQRRLARWGGLPVETRIGAQFRYDHIGAVGLYRTVARVRRRTVREDRVGEGSLGLYGQSEVRLAPWIRTTFGLRADGYRFDVEASDPVNAGVVTDGLLAPKAGVVLGPWRDTEVYVNAGHGFHSNDARGATITRDPTSGRRVDPVDPLVRARGVELGVRTVAIPRLQSTLTLWRLGLDSELVFAGDAGTTEASRPSVRYGVEWTNYARLGACCVVDADLAWSRARFTDPDQAGDRIPGAVGTTVSAGLAVDEVARLFGSVRVRYFGPRPLVEDGRVRSAGTRLVQAQIGYRLAPRARLVADAFNLFDERASDIDYFYRSRLPGEPLAGVEDVHTHPAVPRTFRVGLRFDF